MSETFEALCVAVRGVGADSRVFQGWQAHPLRPNLTGARPLPESAVPALKTYEMYGQIVCADQLIASSLGILITERRGMGSELLDQWTVGQSIVTRDPIINHLWYSCGGRIRFGNVIDALAECRNREFNFRVPVIKQWAMLRQSTSFQETQTWRGVKFKGTLVDILEQLSRGDRPKWMKGISVTFPGRDTWNDVCLVTVDADMRVGGAPLGESLLHSKSADLGRRIWLRPENFKFLAPYMWEPLRFSLMRAFRSKPFREIYRPL